MNPRATIVLAVLAVILGAVAVYVVIFGPDEAEITGTERHLFDFKVTAVERLTVRRRGSVAYDVERDGEKWVYREPPLGDADPARVALVVSDLRFALAKHDLSASGEKPGLDRYGLSPPTLEVRIQTSGKTVGFDVGGTNPTNDGVFVRTHHDNHVVVASLVVLKDLDVAPEFFKAGEAPVEGPTRR